MSRQIIKTRPQRPYIVTRIILVAIALIVILIAIAYSIAEHRARIHNAALSARALIRQDMPEAFWNPQSPLIAAA